jgi:hypothetical protein
VPALWRLTVHERVKLEDSAQNNSTTSHHAGAPLLQAFAKSAGDQSAAGRILSRVQHSRRPRRPHLQATVARLTAQLRE